MMKRNLFSSGVLIMALLFLCIFFLASCETKITYSKNVTAQQAAFLDTVKQQLQCEKVAVSQTSVSQSSPPVVTVLIKNSKILENLSKDSVAGYIESIIRGIIRTGSKEDTYQSLTIEVVSSSSSLLTSTSSSVSYSYDAQQLQAIHSTYFPSHTDSTLLTVLRTVNTLLDEKKYHEVILIADSIIEKDHNTVYPLMFKALASRGNHDLSAAIAHLELARRIDSTDIQVMSLLGMMYYEKGNHLKATEFLDRALKNNPDNKRALYYCGLLYKDFNRKSYGDSLIRKSASLGYEDAILALKKHGS